MTLHAAQSSSDVLHKCHRYFNLLRKLRSLMLACVIAMALCLTSSAKEQTLSWAVAIGGNIDDWASKDTLDGAGNIYTTRQFKGTVDFDHGPEVFSLTSTEYYRVAFVQKLDTDSALQWAVGIGGSG